MKLESEIYVDRDAFKAALRGHHELSIPAADLAPSLLLRESTDGVPTGRWIAVDAAYLASYDHDAGRVVVATDWPPTASNCRPNTAAARVAEKVGVMS